MKYGIKSFLVATILIGSFNFITSAQASEFYFGFNVKPVQTSQYGVVHDYQRPMRNYHHRSLERYTISYRHIMRGLYRQGFRDVAYVGERPHAYILHGYAGRGQLVRILVDKYTGQVLRVRPL